METTRGTRNRSRTMEYFLALATIAAATFLTVP